jgi:hypothetical protein
LNEVAVPKVESERKQTDGGRRTALNLPEEDFVAVFIIGIDENLIELIRHRTQLKKP